MDNNVSGNCDLSVIIPAFNEKGRIGPTLDAVVRFLDGRGFDYELLVVDDGSSDGTADWVRALVADRPRCRVLSYTPNRGKGYAVRTGVADARGRLILFSDADHSVPIEELDRFLAYFEQGFDVVIASRYVSGSQVVIKQPWYRILWSRFGNFFIQRLLLPGIRDVYCGFKCYTNKCAKDVFALQRRDGLTFDIEILAIARHLGYKVVEVPVVWRDDRNSRLSPGKEAYRGIRDLCAIKWDQIRGWRSMSHERPASLRDSPGIP